MTVTRIAGSRPAGIQKAPSKKVAATPKRAPTARTDGFVARGLVTTPGTAKATTAKTSYQLDANGAYFPDLMKLIGGAKQSIDLVQYNFFSESGESKQVADALIAKKKANPTL